MFDSTQKSVALEDTCSNYELQSFDHRRGASPPCQTQNSDFKAFYNNCGNEEEAFRCEPSDGRDRAAVIIAQAEESAEKMIAEANERKASIEQESYEKGYSQGEKDGREMGAKKLDKVLEKIHDLLQAMESSKLEFHKEYQKETLALICRIAEAVVRSKLELDHEVVRETIFEAFKLAADKTEIKIRVNPGDMEWVKDLRPQFFERVSEMKTMTMESDPGIRSGGCIMETAFGQVDARIESQLEKITTAVKEAFVASCPDTMSSDEA